LDTDTQIAVIARDITYITQSLERIERAQAGYVSRSEWDARLIYVDKNMVELVSGISKARADARAMVAEVKAEAASRRAPWWTIVAAIAGILAVVAYVFDLVPQIVN
jgi:hypothetical protein